MNIYEQGPISDSFVIEGNLPGPHVVVMGGVHGDELCGIAAYHWLQQEAWKNNRLIKGKVTVILGNPRAAALNTRCTEEDLNRCYDGKLHQSYEGMRVKEIISVLDRCDALLDIHSTSSPSVPMTCSDGMEETLSLCKVLGVPYITLGWGGKVEGEASDEYMAHQKKIGITLECGQHTEEGSIVFAQEAVNTFLSYFGMLENLSPLQENDSANVVEIKETIYPGDISFHFKPPLLPNFTFFRKGADYAEDREKIYTASYDCVIVFPSKVVTMGVEACFLGKVL